MTNALTGAEISTFYKNRAPKLSQTGSEWRGPCPIHGGHSDSFVVNASNGTWFCHSECGTGGSIFQLEEKLNGETGKAVARAVYEAAGRPATTSKRKGHFVTAYGYTDESGEVLFECVRFAEPKGFSQRRPDGNGGYFWNLKSVRLIPYRLPKVLASDVVYICEGEKDVASLETLGLVASCNPMGAGCWRPEFNQYFRDKNIIVLPDADEVGQKHGNNVAQQLSSFASAVRVVNVPAHDITEWIGAGATAQELEALVHGAPVFVPLTETAIVPAQGVLKDFRRTDIGNAKRFVARYGSNLRYVPAVGEWLLWDEAKGRWVYDKLLIVNKLAIAFTEDLFEEVNRLRASGDSAGASKLFQHAMHTEKLPRQEAMLRGARALVTISPDQLDADRFLLNCVNGTIDLRTGTLRPHKREDLITKQSPVSFDPSARCEEWEHFLRQIMLDDEELVGFLQRAVGYTLTGDNREEVFFFCHGKSGGNGKGTFRDCIASVLGDYGVGCDFATFQEASFSKGGSAATPDIARLAGRRFVHASESDAAKKLNAGLVKSVTGRDPITARFLRQDNFTFIPQFKLWLQANDAPLISDEDEGTWRRVMRIPFHFRAVTPDLTIKDRLANATVAGPGILAWAVAGCLDWQAHGLRVPDIVRQSVSSYREGMDPLAAFYEEVCVFGSELSVKGVTLHAAYVSWCQSRGVRDKDIISRKALSTRVIKHRGCKSRDAGKNGFVLQGVGLRAGDEEQRDEFVF